MESAYGGKVSIEVPEVAGLTGQRALVTGAAGFIGSSLARVLLRSGAEVIAYDNLATGSLANLESSDSEGYGKVKFVHGDVRDWEKLRRNLPGVDVVFHLACLGVRHSLHSPHENHDVNASGTLTVLSQARSANVRRIVHVSSSEVYGTAQWVPMTEQHITDPHTVYGASKLAGECYARAYHRCYGTDVVVLRPFNAYGPRSHSEGDSGEVIPRLLLRALTGKTLTVFGDGTQTRDFTHVYDTAGAMAAAGAADDVSGLTLNVGSGAEISVNELADLIRKVTGRDAPVERTAPRPGDVLRLFAESTRAAEKLGYSPTVPLDQGLEDLAGRLEALGPDRLTELTADMQVRNWE
jgi:UDP-glucose 4-epimerase